MTQNRSSRRPLASVLTILWTYLVIALLYRESVAGITVRLLPLLALIGAGALGFSAILARAEKRGRLAPPQQLNLLAAAGSILFCLLAADFAFTVWTNAKRTSRPSRNWQHERMSDSHVWHGELYPRSYFPTDRKFTLYKPGARVEAVTYGEFYESRMLESQTLVESVLQQRPLIYSIDEYGLRNRVPLDQARLFALGDSFVFGYSTTEGRIWVDRLAEIVGEPVYNMGVSATGPGVQVQLLDYILRTHRDAARPERLLWMLFEGNDLENSYAEHRSPPTSGDTPTGLFDGTMLGGLLEFPEAVKRQSILGRLRGGDLKLAASALGGESAPYLVDGIRLSTPLYRSDRWGRRLFNPQDIERATLDESYLMSHPHRPLLDRAFEEMRELAVEFDFRVTVLVAPTAARLYGADFDGMPTPSTEPHFIRYIEELAQRNGFDRIDLLPALTPGADGELLYYRDDHHWNARGNDVVAQTIAAARWP